MLCRTICALLLVLPVPLAAQVRASELGSISQVIDGTRISLEYSRPRARGRDTLFGTPAVKWGETWTPGANWATTLDVDKPVKLNGHPVPKGKYSVWMVVRKGPEWTVVLEPKVHLYHMEPPDSSTKQIRFGARVEPSPFTEVLTWSMPAIRMNGGTLAMQWERVRVPIDVEVQPSLVSTLSAADAAPYLGEYSWSSLDSLGKVVRTKVLTITHENGTLKAQWTPDHPYFKKFALIRIAPDWFVPGIYDDKGELYEVLKPDIVVEFARADGKVTSLAMRDDEDKVFGRATRKP
jgi:hypothetical protein